MSREVTVIVPAVLLGGTVGLAVGWLLPEQWVFIVLVALAATLMVGIIAILDDEERDR